MSYKRYWLALSVVILASFAVLGGVGRKMISQAPPLPDVYTTDGQLLFAGSTITDGQGVWQSIGGQEIGTVWGHGAYVAPDWSADWIHRESEYPSRPLGTKPGSRRLCRARCRPAGSSEGAPDSRNAHQQLRCQPESRDHRQRPRSRICSSSRPTMPTSLPTAARNMPFPRERSSTQQNKNNSPHSSGGPPGRPARTAPAPT